MLTEIYQEGSLKVANRIYLLEDHIQNGFNDDGEQIAPIAIIVNSKKWKLVGELVKANGHFSIGLLDHKDDKANFCIRPQYIEFEKQSVKFTALILF